MSEWFNVAEVDELGDRQLKLITVDDTDIAVINLGGEYIAIEDVCSHDGAAMLGCGLDVDDILDGDQIICPRHGARFCLKTGEALTPPAYEPIARFPVRIHDGMIQTRDDRWD